MFCLLLLLCTILTFSMLLADSADDKLMTFFLILCVKIGFDILCKLSPKETICMKCQILFSRKNKKNISKCHLLLFVPSMWSIKATSHPRHMDIAVNVLCMWVLNSHVFMAHQCTLGAAICHQVPPCPLHTQPRTLGVWIRYTNVWKFSQTKIWTHILCLASWGHYSLVHPAHIRHLKRIFILYTVITLNIGTP